MAGTRRRCYVVVLHPEERSVSLKTLQHNGLPCDWPDRQRPNLTFALSHRGTRPNANLCLLTQAAAGKRITAVANVLGIDGLGGAHGHLRRFGPTRDMGCRYRSLPDTQTRGRWMSDAFIRLYRTEGRTTEQRAKILQTQRGAVLKR